MKNGTAMGRGEHYISLYTTLYYGVAGYPRAESFYRHRLVVSSR